MSNMRKPLWILLAAILSIGAGTYARVNSRIAAPEWPMDGRLRIVSLAPSVTEILFALDRGDLLVGVTDRCDYPPEATRIARVGKFGVPNVERLLSLCPNVVIAAGLEQADVAPMLQQSGIQVIELQIRNFEEMFDAIRQIGDVVNSRRQADGLVARMRAELEAAGARSGARAGGQRPKVFVEIGDHPLITAGGTSFLDDLIARAGGVNVAHEIPHAYPSINPEKVIAWNPDVIMVASMGRSGKVAVQMSRRIGWADISAVKNGRVIDDIHPDLLFRPGPRLIDGVKAMAVRLHVTGVEP